VARKELEADPSLGPTITPVHIGGDSLVDRLLPHLKKIAVALVALAAVLTVVFTWRWYQHSKQEKSTTRLVTALELGDRPVTGSDLDLAALSGGDVSSNWSSYDERAQASLTALAKVGSARSAARLYEANQLLAAGKLPEALAIYRKQSNGAGDDAVLAREGVGAILETQAGALTDAKDQAQKQQLLDDALAAYRAMQPDDKGPRRDFALYHEARVLSALGKSSEAVSQLQRALELVPTSSLKYDIDNRLAELGASPTP
jgi:tetratricopeptide (TPR) repeat protein